ncbi:MAG: FAD-dependent oxidoreductase [Candidatus Pacearchaeota archaeon]
MKDEKKDYDVAIIGSGITGSAISYVLSNFSNVEDIAVIEKYSKVASVQSSKDNNSQTLHFGDIETNYSLEKAKKVKEGAELVMNYLENNPKENLHSKYGKMALAIGDKEIKSLQERHKNFKKIFPNLKKLETKEIKKKEPKVVEGRENENLLAYYTDNGYTVDYQRLAKSFIDKSKSDLFLNSKVKEVEKTEKGYKIKTYKEEINAKVLVVAASANSLGIAHSLGYGKDLILLPVMGDFYKSKRKLLNGKVYMMQDPKLPFAAIHGDPDVSKGSETRFGPIAQVWPVLERNNKKSFGDFLKLFQFRIDAIHAMFKQITDPTYFKFVFWNMLYSMPFFGKRLFLREVRKIIPSLKPKDIEYGKNIGGIRPQVLNVKTKKIEMGEAKIIGENSIFNITPSPGASVCLDNAYKDANKIIDFLNKEEEKYNFHEHKFKKDLRKRKY